MTLDRTLLVLALTLVAACTQPAAETTSEATPTAAPAVETSEPEIYKNTIRWRTASEVDNFGFDVYRGDTEGGPFARLTDSPISGAGTTDAPTSYEFADDTIDPERAYWYYVESISMNNKREKFTPTYCAKPKIGPNSCDQAEAEDEEEATENSAASEG